MSSIQCLNNMFDRKFDPYDLLIQMNKRLQEVEQKHNMLAQDYQRSQADLNIALNSLQNLQRSYLKLSQLVTMMQK